MDVIVHGESFGCCVPSRLCRQRRKEQSTRIADIDFSTGWASYCRTSARKCARLYLQPTDWMRVDRESNFGTDCDAKTNDGALLLAEPQEIIEVLQMFPHSQH